MAMVRIRIVRMRMAHRFMAVAMRMRPCDHCGMIVRVVLVVRVRMVVLHRFMAMCVGMVLGKM